MSRLALIALHAVLVAAGRAVARSAGLPAGAPVESRGGRWCTVPHGEDVAATVLWLTGPEDGWSPETAEMSSFTNLERGKTLTIMADFAPDGAPAVTVALTCREVVGWRADRLRAAWRAS